MSFTEGRRRSRHVGRSLWADTRGAAYVEMLFVFPTLFMFFTAMVQLGLLYVGSLVVQHAAERAARAAAVVMDDDPRFYQGDPRGSVEGTSASSTDLATYYARGLGTSLGIGAPSPGPRLVSRRATVELAALVPLLSLSRRPPGSLVAASDYAVRATRVTLRVPQVESPATRIEREIEVRVSFAFQCAIPVGARVVCRGPTRVIEAVAFRASHRARYPY